MKIVSFLIILILASCSNSSLDKGKYSHYGYDPSGMTEKEIYVTWGLEAPDQIYAQLMENMDKKGFGIDVYCDEISMENPLSNFINVKIKVDSLSITDVSVHRSDYSNKVNKLIERLIEGMKWDDEKGNERQSGDFDFRIDVSRLCE